MIVLTLPGIWRTWVKAVRYAFSLISPDPSYTRSFGVFLSLRTLLFWNILFALRDRLEVRKKVRLHRGTVTLILDNYRELDRIDRYKTKEPETIKWIEEEVCQGDVFWDVGANIGQYSIYCAAATRGKVLIYSFEPESTNFAKLNRNIALNRYQEIIIPYNIALSNKTELGNLNVTSLKPGYATHQLNISANVYKASFCYCHQQGVLTSTVDDLVDHFLLRPPNHIKIDVDGVENLIIEGSRNVLAHAALKTMLIEVNQANENAVVGSLLANNFIVSGRAEESNNIIFKRRM